MAAIPREWRCFLQDQPRPGQAIGVMRHATIQPHPLEVTGHLPGYRHIGKCEAQFAGQLLVRLRGRG